VEKYSTAGQATDDKIIRRRCIACWIPKTTDILRIGKAYCFRTTTLFMRTHLSVTFICALPDFVINCYSFRTVCFILSYLRHTVIAIVNQNVRIVSVAYFVAGFYNESYRKTCMLDLSTAMKLLQPGCRNISETKEPPQSSRRQKCDMEQDPYSEPTSIGRHPTKFSRHGDMASGIHTLLYCRTTLCLVEISVLCN
jgi:hypothetical protein